MNTRVAYLWTHCLIKTRHNHVKVVPPVTHEHNALFGAHPFVQHYTFVTYFRSTIIFYDW